MISYLDILHARRLGPVALNEASLGRAYQHTKNGHFAILTSWRAANSHEDNEENFKALQHAVRSHGKGFFKLKGSWRECQKKVRPDEYRKVVGDCPNGYHVDGTGHCAVATLGAPPTFVLPYQKCPPEDQKESKEPALFVPGLDLSHALNLVKKYEQDAFIYAGPETKGEVHLVFQDGSMKKIGAFHPNHIAQAYSSLKGHAFTFEGYDYPAQDWTDHLIEMTYRPE